MKTKAPTARPGKSFWANLGPGLITGASDDDPSGIATYVQGGARFGYGMLWTLLFTFPLMVAIQEISARIGRVTGKGIASNIRAHCPKWLLYATVGSLCVANTVNVAADLGAMGAALKLVVGGNAVFHTTLIALVCVAAEIFIPYSRYVSVLKWLSVALLAYVATAFVIHVSWSEVARHALVPQFTFHRESFAALAAIFGTTISPYLFFWQASEEVEDLEGAAEEKPLLKSVREAPTQFARIRMDTLVGMAVSNFVAFFIMITGAAALHVHGIMDIETASQAAEALRPLAGNYAFLLFSLGILGTGLLAVPVLAGSAAYAVGEALGWPVGLEKKPFQARGFYAVILVSTLGGLLLNYFGVNPMRSLYFSAMVNGVLAAPIMVLVMWLSTRSKVMGKFAISGALKALGWTATVVMLLVTIALFATL